jgi:hypothetical protein
MPISVKAGGASACAFWYAGKEARATPKRRVNAEFAVRTRCEVILEDLFLITATTTSGSFGAAR